MVVVEVERAEAELAADALWQAGASAVGEADLGDGRVRLTADVPDPTLVPARWAARPVEVDHGADLDAWRAHAEPVRAGQRVLLVPAWREVPPAGPDDVVVVLDPGRAFGSGSHPATRLVIAALEPRLRPGDRVLDVGCGSGVLAVVALRLGAGAAVGIDIDPAAVAATRENAARNEVADRLEVDGRPLAEVDGAFDLVLANIGVRALTDLAPALAARVAPGGHLVLSGLLEDQADAVVARCAPLTEVARLAEDGWAAPVLTAG